MGLLLCGVCLLLYLSVCGGLLVYLSVCGVSYCTLVCGVCLFLYLSVCVGLLINGNTLCVVGLVCSLCFAGSVAIWHASPSVGLFTYMDV